MSNKTARRSIKEILNDMRARGGAFADFANELEESVNREFAEFANELKSQFSFLLKNEMDENQQ